MLYPPIDPNGRFRQRRASARRRKRLRQSALIAMLLALVALFGLGAQLVGGDGPDAASGDISAAIADRTGPRPLPVEIRGVHVTIGLASLPGKLEEYVDLESEGLTAIELDIKDENGEIGFSASSLKLARQVGATRDFYDAREAASLVHARGLYLIGRIVVFED